MDRAMSLTKSQQTKLIALLGTTIFAPLGAIVAFVSLAAALFVCRQAGVLRTKFLIFLAFAIGAVAIYVNAFGGK
jgi:hypothetical protein